jgi:hypothetical protein
MMVRKRKKRGKRSFMIFSIGGQAGRQAGRQTLYNNNNSIR